MRSEHLYVSYWLWRGYYYVYFLVLLRVVWPTKELVATKGAGAE